MERWFSLLQRAYYIKVSCFAFSSVVLNPNLKLSSLIFTVTTCMLMTIIDHTQN